MNTLENKAKAPASLKLLSTPLFRFFASLKLAVIVLVTLMIVLAVGTILESLHGTETARLLVYETRWFSFLLLFLGINVTAAAFSRYPWKVKHIGFVITHAGIILVLVGSFMTQKLMIDGQMVISEGDTEHRITLPNPVLYIFSEKEERTHYVDLEKKAFPWQGLREIKQTNDGTALPFEMNLTAYYPKARMEEEMIPASVGEPALKVQLHNNFVDQEAWLIRNHAQSSLQMGPAKLVFGNELLKESAPEAPEAAYLEFEFENEKIHIPLKANAKWPADFSLKGTPYKVTILKTFRNATVMGKELVEQEDKTEGAGQNPAVQLILKGKDLEERHTVFAKYPEFPTVHGMKPSAAGAHVFYRLPNAGSRGETHEIHFVEKDGKIFCQIVEGRKITTHEVTKGQTIPTGWMGNLTVTIEEYYPHASMKRTFIPQPNNTENEEAVSVIRLEIQKVPGSSEGVRNLVPFVLWLRQNVREELMIGNVNFHFMYGEKNIPAGFKLMLRDFRMHQYPGTDNPASFESDVTLKDDSRGMVKEVNISMNKPLVHRSFRIYQSGYSQPEGQPEISIFSVGKDPGVPVKYLGAIVMVCGIITMFYTRRFSLGKKTL